MLRRGHQSHRSPGFGFINSFVRTAFSAVLRERDSNVTRSRETPKLSSKDET
jgi:hypothetical protein